MGSKPTATRRFTSAELSAYIEPDGSGFIFFFGPKLDVRRDEATGVLKKIGFESVFEVKDTYSPFAVMVKYNPKMTENERKNAVLDFLKWVDGVLAEKRGQARLL